MASASSLQGSMENCIIIAEEEPNPEAFLAQINSLKEDGLLPRKCFFAVGTSDYDYELVKALLPELEEARLLIFILPPGPNSSTSFEPSVIEADYPNISFFEWSIDYHTHPEYYLADREHLSKEGIDSMTSSLLSAVNTYLEDAQ